ncbi:HIT family protein [Candidatus Woesearchaeota archaeon]|nr:MAG: HIT family protein [Candidatus Woesearchaeota archaeon]
MLKVAECPFCLIREGEREKILFEDDKVFVILSKKQITRGHALVISKQHVDSYFDLSEDVALRMVAVAREIGPKILAGVGAPGCLLSVNVGEAARRSVPHAHVHIIPRFFDDGLAEWDRPDAAPEELASLYAHLRKYL